MVNHRILLITKHLYIKYRSFVHVVLGVIGGIIVAVGCIYILHPQLISKKYVYVDVPKIIEEVSKVLGDQAINEQDRTNLVQIARNSFYLEIEQYSKTNNVVIVSNCKTISGAKDITSEIIPKVLEKLP